MSNIRDDREKLNELMEGGSRRSEVGRCFSIFFFQAIGEVAQFSFYYKPKKASTVTINMNTTKDILKTKVQR